VRSRNREASNVVFFQSHVTSFLVDTYSLALFSAALVLCSCLMLETKFHTHVKQKAKLHFSAF